jgi:hypothetical protein
MDSNWGTIVSTHLLVPFPSIVSSPCSVATCAAQRRRAQAGVAAPPSARERAVPAPSPPPLPSLFFPPSASTQQLPKTPPHRLLQFTRAQPPRRPSNRPPTSAFFLLSTLGHRQATAFLSPVSVALTQAPCDLSCPSPSSSSRGAAGPPRSPMEPPEHRN